MSQKSKHYNTSNRLKKLQVNSTNESGMASTSERHFITWVASLFRCPCTRILATLSPHLPSQHSRKLNEEPHRRLQNGQQSGQHQNARRQNARKKSKQHRKLSSARKQCERLSGHLNAGLPRLPSARKQSKQLRKLQNARKKNKQHDKLQNARKQSKQHKELQNERPSANQSA